METVILRDVIESVATALFQSGFSPGGKKFDHWRLGCLSAQNASGLSPSGPLLVERFTQNAL